jgi:hypothetical protein
MKKLIAKLKGLGRWLVHRTPEVLLCILAILLLPLVAWSLEAAAGAVRKMLAAPGAFFTSRATLAWAVCLVGMGALIALVVWKRHLIWAVARKMILEALHRKVAAVLLVFFIVLMPSLPFILKTEGNPKSQVQIILTYSLILGQVLLSLLAVFLCLASVCGVIDH